MGGGAVIPVVVGPRRPGDVTIYTADPTLAKEEMGWEAKKDLDVVILKQSAAQRMASPANAA